MKIIFSILCFFSCHIYASENVLSENGYGKIKFGYKYSEFSKELGKVITQTIPSNNECNQIKFENYPFAYFMIENGIITRAEVDNSVSNTLGISVGEKFEIVIKNYPHVVVEPHKYDPEGHYLIFKSNNGKSAIVMEEGNGIITEIRAGLEPSVEYVEGCL